MLQKTLNVCKFKHCFINSINKKDITKKQNREIFLNNLLLENGGLFLTENGNYILLQ